MNFTLIFYLIGMVLTLEAAFLLLPAIVALIYGEVSGFSFLIVALLCLLIGLFLIRQKPKKGSFFTKDGFVGVALCWIILSVMGALPFVISGEIPSFIDALFETISGFTTTGSSILENVELLSKGMIFWRSFTHWIGGMGVLVFLLAILPSDGNGYNMNLMRAESPGPSVGKLVPHVRNTAGILYKIYLFLTVLEIVILLIGGMPLFDALTMSFGTAGTGGFGIKLDSAASYAPHLQWTITIFLILFGINFNVYYYMLLKRLKEALGYEELRYYIGIIVVSIVIIAFNIVGSVGSMVDAVRHSAFQVASIITTAGFSTTDFNAWPELSKMILVSLMFIGACAGSTGGGFKVSRVVILVKSGLHELHSFIHPRSVKLVKMNQKEVTKPMLASINNYLVLYIILFVISVFLISFENKGLVTSFTAVAATFNNIGPGLEMVGPMGNFGHFTDFSKFVLMFDMLAGRLEIIPMLLLFSPSVWKK